MNDFDQKVVIFFAAIIVAAAIIIAAFMLRPEPKTPAEKCAAEGNTWIYGSYCFPGTVPTP